MKADAAGVYGIECVPARAWYVGATKRLAKRKAHHLSTIRSGRHQNRRLVSLCESYGFDAFRWHVLEGVVPGDDLDGRLSAAERRWQDCIKALPGVIVVSDDGQMYRDGTRRGRTMAVVLSEFRAFCKAHGLHPNRELDAALAAHMRLIG